MSYITLDSFGTKTNITNPFCNIAVEISLIRDNVSSRASSPLDLQSLIDEDEEDQEQEDQEQEDQEQEDQEQEDQEQDHEDEDQDHTNLTIDELLDGYDSDDHAMKFGAYYASVN